MTDIKLPELPDPDESTAANYGVLYDTYSYDLVERIQKEAYEAGYEKMQQAYVIAHEQAMENGGKLMALRARVAEYERTLRYITDPSHNLDHPDMARMMRDEAWLALQSAGAVK